MRRSKILQALKEPQRDEEMYYDTLYVGGSRLTTSEAALVALERDLEKEFGDFPYEKIAIQDERSVVTLKRGDKLIRLKIRAEEFSTHPEANSQIGTTKEIIDSDGVIIFCSVFPYIPHPITEAAQLAALQAALYGDSKKLFTDMKLENVKAKDIVFSI